MKQSRIFTLLILGMLGCETLAIQAGITVPSTSGTLIGNTVSLDNGARVHQFLGVPYAQAPIGALRFEKPQPITNASSNLVMAQSFKPTCIQMKHFSQAISPLLDVDDLHTTSEDCLYLNVYMPADISEESKLPIMVWLPGEGFDFADARQYNGAYLAALGNVIVVTVQYRVGAFGFLKDNAGLWDQIEALKWINKNAASFGGDAERVTLFGRFSGSMSISILLSSPVVINSEVPLFSRAILMSGVAVGQWVFEYENVQRNNQLLGTSECKQMECLKSLSSEQILTYSGYGWKPTFDGQLVAEEPISALRTKKFPKFVKDIMLGTNKFEGNLCLLKHMVVDRSFYDNLVSNNISSEEYTRIVREDLQMFYGQSNLDGNLDGIVKDPSNYVEFCAELLINAHMRKYQMLLKRIVYDSKFALENVFDYKLDYKPAFSIAPAFINSSIHGDDVILAFGLAFKNMSFISQQDREISRIMVEMFSSFASVGTPYVAADESFEIRHKIDLLQSPFLRIRSSDLVILFVLACLVIVLYALAYVFFKTFRKPTSDIGKKILITEQC